MSRGLKYERRLAVRRYQNGEKTSSICASLGKSRFWLYKWVNRFDPGDPFYGAQAILWEMGDRNVTPLPSEAVGGIRVQWVH